MHAALGAAMACSRKFAAALLDNESPFGRTSKRMSTPLSAATRGGGMSGRSLSGHARTGSADVLGDDDRRSEPGRPFPGAADLLFINHEPRRNSSTLGDGRDRRPPRLRAALGGVVDVAIRSFYVVSSSGKAVVGERWFGTVLSRAMGQVTNAP